MSQTLVKDAGSATAKQSKEIACPTFEYKEKFDKVDPLLDVSLAMLNDAVRKTHAELQKSEWRISPKERESAIQSIIGSAQGIFNELVDAQRVQKTAGRAVNPELQQALRERAKPYVLTEVMKAAVSGIAKVSGKEMGALGEKAKVGEKINKGEILFCVDGIGCIKQSFDYTVDFEKAHQNRWRATFTAPGDSIGNTPVVSLKRGEEVSGEITNPNAEQREQYEVLKLTKLVSIGPDGQEIKKKRALPPRRTQGRGGRGGI